MTQGTRDRFKSLPDIEWLPPYFLTPRTAPGGIHLKKVVFLGYTDMAAAGRLVILNEHRLHHNHLLHEGNVIQ